MAPRKINKTKQLITLTIARTSNNQRLWSAGDNDRRSKRSLLNAFLGIDFASHTVSHPQFYAKSGKRTPMYL